MREPENVSVMGVKLSLELMGCPLGAHNISMEKRVVAVDAGSRVAMTIPTGVISSFAVSTEHHCEYV